MMSATKYIYMILVDASVFDICYCLLFPVTQYIMCVNIDPCNVLECHTPATAPAATATTTAVGRGGVLLLLLLVNTPQVLIIINQRPLSLRAQTQDTTRLYTVQLFPS